MSQNEHSKVKKNHNGHRAGRALLAWSLAVVAWVVPAVAQASEKNRAPEPAIRRGVPTAAAVRLRSGFAIALRQARELPECHALFESLNSDPDRLLGETEYVPATSELEKSYCNHRAVAMTNVGQPVTWLCQMFSGLTVHQAAIVVIHEALHVGGLPESPHTPSAMTSQEINSLVTKSCRP